MQIINGTIIDTDLSAISRLELGSTKYLLNRATLNANLDEWNGSWIEIPSSAGGVTIGFEDFSDQGNFTVIGSGKRARPNSRYFDLIENSVFRITNTSADASGTVTSISINAPGFDIDATGAEILIVHPENGESEVLSPNSDFLSASTSVSISSTTLSRTYPVGSYIYMSIGQILQRIYDLENP